MSCAHARIDNARQSLETLLIKRFVKHDWYNSVQDLPSRRMKAKPRNKNAMNTIRSSQYKLLTNIKTYV